MEKAAHHKQKDFCYKRPSYREARRERAIKVYTINQESRYLLVQGVPTVGASKELIERFALYGDVEEYRLLDEYPCEEFTEAYWVKYKRIVSAKHGKRKMDNISFFGGLLHVCYAPEYETVEDTRRKIKERRIKCRNYNNDKKQITSDISNEENDSKSISASHSIIAKRKEQWQYKDDKISQSKTIKINEVSTSIQSPRPSHNNNAVGANIDSKLVGESSLPRAIPKSNSFTSTKNQHQNLFGMDSVSQDTSLPRLPTKNATLPVELQNLHASDVYSVHYRDVTSRPSVSSHEESNFDKNHSIGGRDIEEDDSKSIYASHSIIEKRKKQWQYKDDKISQSKIPKINEVSTSVQSPQPSSNNNAVFSHEKSNFDKNDIYASRSIIEKRKKQWLYKDDKISQRKTIKINEVSTSVQSLQPSSNNNAVSSQEESNFDKNHSMGGRDDEDITQTNHADCKPNNISRKKSINWLKRSHNQSGSVKSTSSSNSPSNPFSTNKRTLQQKHSTTVYQYSQAPGAENPFRTHVSQTVSSEKDSFDGTVQSIQEKLSKTSEGQQRDATLSECPLQATSNNFGLMVPNVIAKKKRNDGRKRI